MEKQLANTAVILNDLVSINNDRILGYEKAIEELKDTHADLKVLFQDMIRESKRYIQALSIELNNINLASDDKGSLGGSIYRAWMEVKATFSGNDRKAVLDSCEYGEDAAQKAYATALESEDLSPELRQIIQNQKHSLRLSHDQIKVLRNQE